MQILSHILRTFNYNIIKTHINETKNHPNRPKVRKLTATIHFLAAYPGLINSFGGDARLRTHERNIATLFYFYFESTIFFIVIRTFG